MTQSHSTLVAQNITLCSFNIMPQWWDIWKPVGWPTWAVLFWCYQLAYGDKCKI